MQSQPQSQTQAQIQAQALAATNAASSPLIRFASVCKIYGSGEATVRALDSVDLTIGPGEFVAIMGPSGSGKSTAMNMIGCLDTPTAGRYEFLGIDVGALSRDQRALLRRQYLGFVFRGSTCSPAHRR